MFKAMRNRWPVILLLGVLVLLAVGCSSGAQSPATAGQVASAPPPPPPPPPAVGKWKLTVETPQGTQEPTLSIMGTDGELHGTFSGQAGDIDLDGVSFNEGELMFSVTIDVQGQSIDLSFSGTVDGDNISGNLDTPFGGFPANGVRVVE